jgi:hypothetical protein
MTSIELGGSHWKSRLGNPDGIEKYQVRVHTGQPVLGSLSPSLGPGDDDTLETHSRRTRRRKENHDSLIQGKTLRGDCCDVTNSTIKII